LTKKNKPVKIVLNLSRRKSMETDIKKMIEKLPERELFVVLAEDSCEGSDEATLGLFKNKSDAQIFADAWNRQPHTCMRARIDTKKVWKTTSDKVSMFLILDNFYVPLFVRD